LGATVPRLARRSLALRTRGKDKLMLDWKVERGRQTFHLESHSSGVKVIVRGVETLGDSRAIRAHITPNDARSLTAALIAAGYGPEDAPSLLWPYCTAEEALTYLNARFPPPAPLYHWLGGDAP
jgi:hypothetical protein